MVPVASIAVTAAIAVQIAAAAVMRFRAIAVGIALRAFATFEQAFLSAGCAIATAAAATAATPAATTAARALALAVERGFRARRAASYVAFAGTATRFAAACCNDSGRSGARSDTCCSRCISTQRSGCCG